MLDMVMNMFTRCNPKRDASIALARIISRYDMQCMGYEEGLVEDRRAKEERHVALGVWLFAHPEGQSVADLDFSSGVPAVTHDLRAEGFGVMTPVRLKRNRFLLATPGENDDDWRFFVCEVRHNTRKPGGWYKLGLIVESAVKLDGDQRAEFRDHVAAVHAGSGAG